MVEIIKFPDLVHCEGCGKPLKPREGVLCPVDDCEAVACHVCADGSLYCSDHIKQDPDYGRG